MWQLNVIQWFIKIDNSFLHRGNISSADAKRAIENANIGKRSGQNVLVVSDPFLSLAKRGNTLGG